MTKGFKVGDKVTVTVGIHTGNVYTLSRVDNSDNTLKFWLDTEKSIESSWHKFGDVVHLVETEEYLNEQRQGLMDKLNLIDSKIQWIKETGSHVYDENQFRVWQAITLAENGSLSKIEKAKAIAELIK
jgi:hypothetical protein